MKKFQIHIIDISHATSLSKNCYVHLLQCLLLLVVPFYGWQRSNRLLRDVHNPYNTTPVIAVFCFQEQRSLGCELDLSGSFLARTPKMRTSQEEEEGEGACWLLGLILMVILAIGEVQPNPGPHSEQDKLDQILHTRETRNAKAKPYTNFSKATARK
jgi:hypothetical protein